MAENQSAHRIQLEKQAIAAQIKRANLGQWFGFILGIVGLLGGVFCIYTGHDVAGASVTGASLIGLVSVFVIGKKSSEKDLNNKK